MCSLAMNVDEVAEDLLLPATAHALRWLSSKTWLPSEACLPTRAVLSPKALWRRCCSCAVGRRTCAMRRLLACEARLPSKALLSSKAL